MDPSRPTSTSPDPLKPGDTVRIFDTCLSGSLLGPLITAIQSSGCHRLELVPLAVFPESIVAEQCSPELPFIDFGHARRGGVEMAMCLSKDDPHADFVVEIRRKLDLPAPTATPPVEFLGKQWRWPELMLMAVELVGGSLEKNELLMPDGYILDCLKRNSRLELLKDAEYVVWDLVRCGVLDQVEETSYRFTYHEKKYSLNQVRSDMDGRPPSSGTLIPYLVSKLASVRMLHSVEFLEYVDAAGYFQFINFDDDLLGAVTEGATKSMVRKMLVDLLFLIRTHLAVIGVVDVGEMGKHYFAFKNKHVTIPFLERLLEKTCDTELEKVHLKCLSLKRLTLTGRDDTKITEYALACVVTDKGLVRREEGGRYIVPRFFSSLSENDLRKIFPDSHKFEFYDFHIMM
jgi:hypothetical protein